jgi:hypothetical protein
MKRLMLVTLCLFLVSCKGKDGADGETGRPGSTGLPGTAEFTLYEGVVSSNAMLIPTPRMNSRSNVSVYIGDSISFTELPYFLPASGINTYFTLFSASVSIINASTAGATRYRIVVMNE